MGCRFFYIFLQFEFLNFLVWLKDLVISNCNTEFYAINTAYIDSWKGLETQNSVPTCQKSLRSNVLKFQLLSFLAVIQVPELFAKLGETPGMNLH